jgi:hypothetical protein
MSIEQAFAAELKIVDESGMVRSVKSVEGSADVTVKAPKSDGQAIKFIRIDGLASPQTQVVTQGTATFSDVVPGTWKILHNPKNVNAVRVAP